MNTRLQQFLSAENLSPTQFADILGIQKSRLSHILSGRNKPGYEFIELFMKKFPNVNMEWLILGKGKMNKGNEDLFSSETKRGTDMRILPELPDNQTEQTVFDAAQLDENQTDENERENVRANDSLMKMKRVVRVTIFYSDGSFDELYR